VTPRRPVRNAHLTHAAATSYLSASPAVFPLRVAGPVMAPAAFVPAPVRLPVSNGRVSLGHVAATQGRRPHFFGEGVPASSHGPARVVGAPQMVAPPPRRREPSSRDTVPIGDVAADERERLEANLSGGVVPGVDSPPPPEEEMAEYDSRRFSEANPPPPLSMKDSMDLWIENILVLYGDKEPRDTVPVAEGEVSDLMGGPFFLALHRCFKQYGPIYKLAFGPKVFIVVNDPVVCRHILRERSILYDKGVLSEILEPIMGKGLIPADYETWKTRRRAIVPGFHSAWLEFMTGMFGYCTDGLSEKLDGLIAADDGNAPVVEMETEYSSLALDIIGKAVFNYDFKSTQTESPVIKAVYRTLREAEYRSTFLFPYWKFEPLNWIVPRQRQFRRDMKLVNDTLRKLIDEAQHGKQSTELDDLKRRDYENVSDPSMLRFLVDLRGESTTNQQLRDDLMTMLIAGHETTAAVLTWATYELVQRPDIYARVRAEVDAVMGDRQSPPTFEDVKSLNLTRRVLAESLRMYPEPPLLIRRLLADDTLPGGEIGKPTNLKRGTDVFICVYSMHRSPALWEEPDMFNPDRWLKPFSNPGVDGWSGYNPPAPNRASLYPNEVNADFAFLPFGGGSRKCVGDQFAMLESTVAFATLVRRFDFSLGCAPSEVGVDTGATIHTKGGMPIRVRKRGEWDELNEASAKLAQQ